MIRETVVAQSIFERLGVTPAINACGVYTDLGGSILSPTVWAAMDEVNRSYVSMADLLDKTGRILAKMVGAEAARVVPGAAAALAMGTAACIARMDGAIAERLPDTTGTKSEVVIQRRQRFKYDRCAALSGARLVEAGDAGGTTARQIEALLGPETAAILLPAHLDGRDGTVPLVEVAALARRHGVPTLVDAAYLNDPPDIMRSFTAAGADLVCFSAKYFGGPNAGGFICGRKELVDAVAALDFTGYESGRYRQFGRAFKLDRQVVVGVVVALEEWMALDPKERWDGYRRRVERMMEALAGTPGISYLPRWFTMDERVVPGRVNCLAVQFDPHPRRTPGKVCELLAQGNPAIRTVLVKDIMVVAADTLLDGQELLIAERLRGICERLG